MIMVRGSNMEGENLGGCSWPVKEQNEDRGGVGGSHHILMLKSELKSIMTSKACKLLITKVRSWRRPKPFCGVCIFCYEWKIKKK